MRKLLFIPIVLLALNAIGQSQNPGGIQSQFVVAVQRGKAALHNGSDTIYLSNQAVNEMRQAQALPNYAVTLTPHDGYGQLYVTGETPTYFLVKQQNSSSDITFDYVVFAQQNRPQILLHP